MKLEYKPIAISDLKYRIKWLNDPEISFYLGTRVRNGTSEEFHRKWFKTYFEFEREGKRKIFMILADGKSVGQIGLMDINKDDDHASLYIAIGEKEYWGKDIGKAAVEFIHSYAKKELRLHKINLEVHAQNKRAISLYEKLGYKEVGISHDNVKRGNKYEDEIIMEFIF